MDGKGKGTAMEQVFKSQLSHNKSRIKVSVEYCLKFLTSPIVKSTGCDKVSHQHHGNLVIISDVMKNNFLPITWYATTFISSKKCGINYGQMCRKFC